MVKRSITITDWLRGGVVRVARIHFLFILAIVGQIIVHDASKLAEPRIIMNRLFLAAFLLVVAACVWFVSNNKDVSTPILKYALLALIIADLVVAGFNVYYDRGMASTATLLFALPIISSAILLKRTAIYMTAMLAIAVYVSALSRYFTDFFNEGYKIQLYSTAAFYSAIFLLLAMLLVVIIRFKEE